MSKRFSDQFKQSAVQMVSSENSIAQVAQRLGIGHSTLDKWVRAHRRQAGQLVMLNQEQKRIRELERQLAQLQEVNDILKKRRCTLPTRQIGEVHVHENTPTPLHSMRALCTALGISRRGYYAWCARDSSPGALNLAIECQFKQDKARSGAPSIANALQHAGFVCSTRTVGRRMQRMGFRVGYAKKFRRTTESNHAHAVAPNHLERQFAVNSPNRVWVSDITYLRTTQGWLYLAVLIDLFSCLVVGWQMSKRIDAKLLTDALDAAMLMRGKPQGVLIHSDRGSQYCSAAFVQQAASYKAVQSMSRKGNCWDNAVAESFFATLKKEEIYGQTLGPKTAVYAQVFECIECDDNRVRRHSSNGWVSPAQFEHNYHQRSAV